jgi:flagellar motor switch protein FliG
MFERLLIVYPFNHFYKKCSPENFIAIFKNEMPQTIAFILSFCSKQKYIQKVIKLLISEKVCNNGDITLIINYLRHCKTDFNPTITRNIENYCDKKINNLKNGFNCELFRKNVFVNLK